MVKINSGEILERKNCKYLVEGVAVHTESKGIILVLREMFGGYKLICVDEKEAGAELKKYIPVEFEETERDLRPGDVVQHFKGMKYVIVGFATHVRNGERLVIYRALYEDGCLWARPYNMFMSKMDREKYPKEKYPEYANTKYRMTLFRRE